MPDPNPPKPSDPDPHLPDPTKVNPAPEPIREPTQPEPKVARVGRHLIALDGREITTCRSAEQADTMSTRSASE